MEKFSFFNDVNSDRLYLAEDFARHLAMYFTNGIFNNGCKVSENNAMNVIVKNGSANINGYRYDNDSNKILNIENADGVLSRIDNIVIRLDLSNRNIQALVVKGAFSNEPVAPELVRNLSTYDLRIAKVNIPAGTTTITQDLIEDTRFLNSDCGNVISTVETPDTEDLYSQLYAKADKVVNDSQTAFENWFEDVKNVLDENVAFTLSEQIKGLSSATSNLQKGTLKTYSTTLLTTGWTLNETTNLYEYNIAKEDITENTSVDGIMDLANQAKLSDGYTNSYNGGFKVYTSELPTENIDITFRYQLANITLTQDTGGGENVGEN